MDYHFFNTKMSLHRTRTHTGWANITDN